MPTLNLTLQKQSALKLCWAACTSAVANYYINGSVYTQCILANAMLNRTNCCINLNDCDEPLNVRLSLNHTGNLDIIETSLLSMARIRNEIDNQRPIVVGVRAPHSRHAILITGYDNADRVFIQDPWPMNNPGWMPWATLNTGYLANGIVDETFIPKRGTR